MTALAGGLEEAVRIGREIFKMIVASGNEYRIVLTKEAIDASIDGLQKFLDMAEKYGYKRPEDTVKIRVAIETMMAFSAEHFGEASV